MVSRIIIANFKLTSLGLCINMCVYTEVNYTINVQANFPPPSDSGVCIYMHCLVVCPAIVKFCTYI